MDVNFSNWIETQEQLLSQAEVSVDKKIFIGVNEPFYSKFKTYINDYITEDIGSLFFFRKSGRTFRVNNNQIQCANKPDKTVLSLHII